MVFCTHHSVYQQCLEPKEWLKCSHFNQMQIKLNLFQKIDFGSFLSFLIIALIFWNYYPLHENLETHHFSSFTSNYKNQWQSYSSLHQIFSSSSKNESSSWNVDLRMPYHPFENQVLFLIFNYHLQSLPLQFRSYYLA